MLFNHLGCQLTRFFVFIVIKLTYKVTDWTRLSKITFWTKDTFLTETIVEEVRFKRIAIWRWKNLYQIVIDLTASLGSAAFIIFGSLALAYKSLRIGLISIVPNIFPLAVTGTWLVWRNESLELTSVCAFTVCMGIVVDDTIHFLSRFDEERRTAKNRHEAIRKAFGNVGVAMVMTTVVLVAGFGTVAFSDSRDHHIFASMGAITIAAALFGDLVMLPAMLACFAEKTDEEKLL